MERKAKIIRKTKETDIQLNLNLDGKGKSDINTGIPFVDHMLDLMAAHGFMDVKIIAKGDIEIDYHHTVEDLGICLGDAISKALGERKGITRYGHAIVPMDESLASVVIDICNRPYLAYRVSLKNRKTGNFDTGLIREFFRALTNHSGITMHIDLVSGKDPHHASEAIFKAFGRALDTAVSIEKRLQGDVPSTKGML
ncbi:MAG: imidazoleglycerol-phosphate dehydratase HisB [Deltaproteobacteria bacterium]|nr:imidazoleglycerol-phosphate dehydratase HisB [Deltaproteobacteria bacterium]